MKEKQKTIEERFQKLSPIEHILQRPSMYISSIISEMKDVFIVDDLEKMKIVKKTINFNRGFFAIVDEVLTNASDAFIRNGNVKYIKVNINNEFISVENDGDGIPIEIHKKHKIYVPELIVSHLHSGENFTDTDKRLVAGTHGLGVKLTNIFSNKFTIETADGKNLYYQEFSNNMSKKTKPEIKASKKNYTKVTFYPDLKRFGLSEIDDDIKSVILRRCIDISVYCQGVKLYYNDTLIPIKTFKDYMKLFVDDNSELFTEKINEKWEIGIAKSLDNSFNQISIVNGITTYNGGTHVNIIINDLAKKTQEILSKKYKKLNIKANDIKNNTFVFVSATLPNPAFDTQTKETLITKISDIELSEKLIKQFSNSSIIEDVVKFLNIKEQVNTKKEIGKHKIKISKLEDAKKAGTYESDKCMLFLTEGDSAFSSVISGFSENSDYYGVFPCKGKPINVRDVNLQKIRDNEEIKNIINILGLEFGKKYADISKLRYGKVVLMADADCLEENTLILTKRGHIPIKEITYEDEVLTHNGAWKKVINIIKTKKNKYISINLNGTFINIGEFHKIPVLRDGEINVIYAKDILKTDFLLIKNEKM
jgi:DNA topoisomerase-2